MYKSLFSKSEGNIPVHMAKAANPWPCLLYTSTMSSSWTELSAVLRKKGYVFVCDPYRRYATIRSLGAKKCMRTFRLGAEYDKRCV